jgi:hypothetical protein
MQRFIDPATEKVPRSQTPATTVNGKFGTFGKKIVASSQM